MRGDGKFFGPQGALLRMVFLALVGGVQGCCRGANYDQPSEPGFNRAFLVTKFDWLDACVER
jgi:hypothetical protein